MYILDRLWENTAEEHVTTVPFRDVPCEIHDNGQMEEWIHMMVTHGQQHGTSRGKQHVFFCIRKSLQRKWTLSRLAGTEVVVNVMKQA